MDKKNQQPPLRVGMISLGCAKNLVDAEIMLGSLLKEGMEITNEAEKADVLIVNTCSFIDSAQEESVDTILESSELRDAKNRGQGLIVSGCLPQRFREDLPKLMPEVDAFMGVDQVPRVAEIVREALEHRNQQQAAKSSASAKKKADIVGRLAQVTKERESKVGASGGEAKRANAAPLYDVTTRPRYIPDYATPRFRLTPRHFAYVKIAEGCNHPCSFCVIPRMRGSHRSRVQTDIVAEARQLIADGVKELNLISQDSTYYGLDLNRGGGKGVAVPANGPTMATLLRELNALPGDFWIRLLYTHPAHWTDDLIQAMADCKKAARYVDMPLQHIHDNMLERMRRETSRKHIEDLIGRLRTGVPGIALRTTFIVGFPGETPAVFESLLDFIRETRFERLGVFAYSKEEGTRAGSMAGHIPEKTREKRREAAMEVQRGVSAEIAKSFEGRVLRVLVEGSATARQIQNAQISSWEHGSSRGHQEHSLATKGLWTVARSEADAPDIDGRVYLRGQLPAGTFARVKIIGHTDYDLIAERE
jgi:ribosomal protein S12 methylthiotransferase